MMENTLNHFKMSRELECPKCHNQENFIVPGSENKVVCKECWHKGNEWDFQNAYEISESWNEVEFDKDSYYERTTV
jgi:hypothetical protein